MLCRLATRKYAVCMQQSDCVEHIQLVKKSLEFYGTQMFTRSRYPYPEPDESNSHPPTPFHYVLIPLHLLLGIPCCVFLSGFPTNILYAFLIPSSMYATCLANIRDLIIFKILLI